MAVTTDWTSASISGLDKSPKSGSPQHTMSRKRSRYEAALVERAADEEDESSEDEGDEEEEDDEEHAEQAAAQTTQQQKRLQIALNKDKSLVCHVRSRMKQA